MTSRLPRRLGLLDQTRRLRVLDEVAAYRRYGAVDLIFQEGFGDYLIGRPSEFNPYSLDAARREYVSWRTGWETGEQLWPPSRVRHEYEYARSQGWSMPWERDDSWTPEPAA